MTDKFDDIMVKKEEAYVKRCEVKEDKKAERFGLFMDMQNKKFKLEVKKLMMKAAFEDSKMLFMKATNLDPDAAKFAQN